MDLIDRVISREGGSKVVRDPADPGGTTKYGIAQRSHPNVDVENLTYEQAREIYRREYLVAPHIDAIEDEYLCEHVFDYAVHSGPAAAIKALQRLLGLPQSGTLDEATLQKLRATPMSFRFYMAYMRERLVFLARVIQKRPSSIKYLAGWTSRVLNI